MKYQRQKGFSLIELVVAMATTAILMLVAGVLMLGSNNTYHQIYASIHDPIRQDSLIITTAFCAVGRKSNRNDYKIYKIKNGSFIEAIPTFGESMAAGQAIEFHYWDRPFYEFVDEEEGMDVVDTGTNYILFYLVDDELHADYGKVVDGVGAVEYGTRKESGDVETRVLVQNVDLAKNTDLFSHEMVGGIGSGCVNLNLSLKNEEGDTMDVKTATLLRVTWPK